MLPTFAVVSLDFGLYTTDNPINVYNQIRPVLNIIEKNMANIIGEDVKIHIHLAHTYENGIKHLVDGKVDFSRLGPAAYIMAKSLNPSIKIIATESFNGKREIYGVIIVHRLSNIEKVEDLKGASFAFGSKKSAIGGCLTQEYLYKHGITSTTLSKYEYLGRYDRVGTAVGLGQFDAGALKENIFISLKDKGVPIREIGRFKNMTDTWVGRGNLPEEIYNALKDSILKINSLSVETFGVNGFVEGNDNDYEKIRDAINNDKFFNSQQ